MHSDSTQKKVGRVRPPRVQITYDVNLNGAQRSIDLPFVIGVLGDFKGQLREGEELPKLKDASRRFIDITPDTFGKAMATLRPYLRLMVENKLSDQPNPGRLVVELDLGKQAEELGVGVFRPDNIAQQVPALRKLLELRERLATLRGKLQGNDKLDAELRDLLAKLKSDEDMRNRMMADHESAGGSSV